MNIRQRLTGAALAVLLGTMSLAGCTWGAEPDGDKNQDASSQQQTDAPQQGDDGAAPESPGGDKPSKAEVVDGYLRVATQALGGELPEEFLPEVVDCFVDEVYDVMSTTTLRALAEGKLWEIDKADLPLFVPASDKCRKLVME